MICEEALEMDLDTELKWYCALIRLQTEIVTPTGVVVGLGDEIVEESFRLFRAPSLAEAERRAEAVGRDETHYLNCDGDTVFWRFVEVDQVQELVDQELIDGVEVFAKLHSAEGAEEEVLKAHRESDS